MEIIVSASQPHPRAFITCISGKALCRPGEAERHEMCSQNTQTPQFLAIVSQTPGRITLLPFPPAAQRKKKIQCQDFPPAFHVSRSSHTCTAPWRGSLHFCKTRKQLPSTTLPSLPSPSTVCARAQNPCLDFPTTARPGCSSRGYYSFLGLFFFLTSFFGFFLSAPLLVISSNLLPVIWD